MKGRRYGTNDFRHRRLWLFDSKLSFGENKESERGDGEYWGILHISHDGVKKRDRKERGNKEKKRGTERITTAIRQFAAPYFNHSLISKIKLAAAPECFKTSG